MLTKSVILGPLIVLVTVPMSVACGGGDDAADPSASTSPLSITKEKLALMPLSATEIGVDPESLQIADESGYLTSNQLAGDTIDPRDSATQIEKMGWVASYKLLYEDPTLAGSSGPQDGQTALDLFVDATAAAAFVDKQLSDTEALEGTPFLGGFVVQNWSTFEVNGGDDGFGQRVGFQFGDLIVNQWVAGFRLGGLVATIGVSRLDDTDTTQVMQQLVTKLEQRVREVIIGTEQVEAIPLPTEDPDAPGTGDRPATGPFLDAMALTLDDLPPGTTIDEEGYTSQAEGIEYERDFDLGPEEGNGGPFGLQVNLALYADETGAISDFDDREDRFLGPGSDALVESVFASQPFEVSNVVKTPLLVTPEGDDAFGVSVTYDMPFGNVENSFVYIRVGNVNATIAFSGFTGETELAYVEATISTLIGRIERELALG
jgi:hypothetical protein